MQPTPTEPTPSAIARTAVTDEEKEPNEQARDLESLSNPAAGTVIATVQQEPTSEDDADVRLHEMVFLGLNNAVGCKRFWGG